MNQLQALWHALLRSTLNTARFDKRMRDGATFSLFVQLVLAIWTVGHLIPLFAQWQAQGSALLSVHLWLTCLLAWTVIALFAALATLMSGLSSDEALLLALQPIEPATRLRILYSQVLWRGVGNWLLCEASVIGLALSFAYGWAALPWLLLLVLGGLCVAWLSMLATLLVARYVLPHLRRVLLYGAMFVASGGLVSLLAQHFHWATTGTFLTAGSIGTKGAALFTSMASAITSQFAVIAIDGVLLLLLLLVWFPLAQRTGLFYLATLQQQQGRDSSPSAFVWPGLGALLALLKRRRTLVGALLLKGLLQQSRHLFTWLRLLVLLALFPLLHSSLAALHLNEMLQVTFYSAGVAFLALLEYAPYAIGSEGARLVLYLVAPFDPTAFLRARLCSYLLPALLVGWFSALLLAIWTGLSLFAFLLTLVLLSLILTGYVVLAVLGSALDADLTQFAEDQMQTWILEEFPITPRRLQLLGLIILLSAAMFLLCWKLPTLGALLALACLDGVLMVVGERIGRVCLARLLC